MQEHDPSGLLQDDSRFWPKEDSPPENPETGYIEHMFSELIKEALHGKT